MLNWNLGWVNTQKTGDPNFWGGVGNLKIFHMIDINEMRAIFQFFFLIMADTDIPFPSTPRKLETQTLGGSVI